MPSSDHEYPWCDYEYRGKLPPWPVRAGQLQGLEVRAAREYGMHGARRDFDAVDDGQPPQRREPQLEEPAALRNATCCNAAQRAHAAWWRLDVATAP